MSHVQLFQIEFPKPGTIEFGGGAGSCMVRNVSNSPVRPWIPWLPTHYCLPDQLAGTGAHRRRVRREMFRRIL